MALRVLLAVLLSSIAANISVAEEYAYSPGLLLSIGQGFDPLDFSTPREECLVTADAKPIFEWKPPTTREPWGRTTLSYYFARDSSELRKSLSLDAKFTASYLKSKLDIGRKTLSTAVEREDVVSFVVAFETEAVPYAIQHSPGGPSLRADAAKYYTDGNFGEFYTLCGPRFVRGFRRVASIYAVVEISNASRQLRDKIDDKLDASGGWGPVSATAALSISSDVLEANASGHVNVNVVATGGAPASLSPKLEEIFPRASTDSKDPQDLKKVVTAAHSWITDWIDAVGTQSDTTWPSYFHDDSYSRLFPNLRSAEAGYEAQLSMFREIGNEWVVVTDRISTLRQMADFIDEASREGKRLLEVSDSLAMRTWQFIFDPSYVLQPPDDLGGSIEQLGKTLRKELSAAEARQVALHELHERCRNAPLEDLKAVQEACRMETKPRPPTIRWIERSVVATTGDRVLIPDLEIADGDIVELVPQSLEMQVFRNADDGGRRGGKKVGERDYCDLPPPFGTKRCVIYRFGTEETYDSVTDEAGRPVTNSDALRRYLGNVKRGALLAFASNDRRTGDPLPSSPCAIGDLVNAGVGLRFLFKVSNTETCDIFKEARSGNPALAIVNDISIGQRQRVDGCEERIFSKLNGRHESSQGCNPPHPAGGPDRRVPYKPKVRLTADLRLVGISRDSASPTDDVDGASQDTLLSIDAREIGDILEVQPQWTAVWGQPTVASSAITKELDLRREFDPEKPWYRIVFAARDNTASGHAFVVIGKLSDEAHASERVAAVGFYPAGNKKDSTKAIIGFVPGEVADEVLRDSERHITERLVVSVDESDFLRAWDVVETWQAREFWEEENQFNLLFNNCNDFLIEVATALRLSVPTRGAVEKPKKYVRRLIESN